MVIREACSKKEPKLSAMLHWIADSTKIKLAMRCEPATNDQRTEVSDHELVASSFMEVSRC